MPRSRNLAGQHERSKSGQDAEPDGRSLLEAFVASAAALDEPDFEAVLDEMFARGSFEQVAGDLVMPALVALGDGWAQGLVDVAGEHAAAGAVNGVLGWRSWPRPGRRR